MTENRRILLNIVATYGRSLFALVCGIFSGRWVLMALGQVDYGLFGLIAGLTGFITFFNGVLASAIGRFYAVSVGAAKKLKSNDALRECRAWFNIAVFVHTIVPILLIAIGYPIGLYVVTNFLTIPDERVCDCIWLFRFVCISCFVGMINVPFQAMYTAKQCIAELTIYSFATTIFNIVFLYFMITHPGDWLIKYGLLTCCISIIPQFIIMLRALIIFPECKIRYEMLFDFKRLRHLGTYAMWQSIGVFSGLMRNQGIAILVNKYFGPKVNAAMQIGNTVNGQANSLTGAMMGAFYPAITSAYGAGDYVRMSKLVFIMCRFGVILSMMFVVPLLLELPELLVLWLMNPPQYAIGFSMLFLVLMLIENSTIGHMIAVNASGQISIYQICMGMISLLALPIAFVLMYLGGSPYVSVYALFVTVGIYTGVRLLFARFIVGLSIAAWISKVALPTMTLFIIEMSIGYLPHLIMHPSLARIVVTSIVCEIVFVIVLWFVIFENYEKECILGNIYSRLMKYKKYLRS